MANANRILHLDIGTKNADRVDNSTISIIDKDKVEENILLSII